MIKPGDIFGSWTVIGDVTVHTRNGRRGAFLCQCECGAEKRVWKAHLINGDSRSCGCKNPRKQAHYKWTGCGDLDGNHWNQIVRNANGKKNRTAFEIGITIEDAWSLFLSQDRKCSLTGLPISLGKERTASLDRISSSRGYVPGNVQWVHKTINKMKNTFTQEEFVAMCRLVAENSRLVITQ